jgi:hypothetical protein
VAQQDSEGLKSSYGVCGSAVSLPSGVWSGTPAEIEIEFGAFDSKIRNLVATKLMLYRKNVDANASIASL